MKFRRLEHKEIYEGFDRLIKEVDNILLENEAGLSKQPNVFIGTDSRKKSNFYIFVSVVIVYFERSGAAVFYTKNIESKFMSMEMRLMREAEYSLEIAHHLVDVCLNHSCDLTIHCDYNPSPEHKSNKIVASALGYITSMGFNGVIKPHSFAASTAADFLCE